MFSKQVNQRQTTPDFDLILRDALSLSLYNIYTYIFYRTDLVTT